MDTIAPAERSYLGNLQALVRETGMSHIIARSRLVFKVFLAYVMSGRPFLVQEFLAMGGIHFISRSQASSGVRNVIATKDIVSLEKPTPTSR